MVSLIEYLRKKGTQDRYSSKHLHLWVTEILEGNLTGPTEEPKWECFLDKIDHIPRTGPLMRRPSTNLDFMQQMILMNEESRREQRELMMIRDEERRAEDRRREDAMREEREERRNDERRRDEMFQRSLMMLVAGKTQTSVMSTPAGGILDWNVQRVQQFLTENGFEEHVQSFVANGIDGPTLTELNHTSLEELGFKSAIERARFLGKVKQIK